MNFLRKLIVILAALFISFAGFGQNDINKKVIQFTGKVVTSDENGDIVPLPYVNVAVMGTNRGAVSEIDGFFSFVALKGETVVFSRIGFESVEYTIPDSLNDFYYSWIQIMTVDNVLLPEVVIYPLPSREHFKQDLLAINIEDELRDRARENLAADALASMRYTVPVDGREASAQTFRTIANEAVYEGQFKPQHIFDVFAWKRFVEAWKRGDFKKKDKK